MSATDTYYTPETSRWKTEFGYDGRMRLRVRKEYSWYPYRNYGNWCLSGETCYIYDGMLVVQERNGSNTPTVHYTRGTDLSGTREGAGGIGGLLARSHGYSSGTWSTHHFYHADGNGNVTAMMNTSQTLSATYKYDALGKLRSSSGTMASANLYRFSSKEFHANSELYYYGYRFYDPGLQRWLNRDPIAETGGINLYDFVRNVPVSAIDLLGLLVGTVPRPIFIPPIPGTGGTTMPRLFPPIPIVPTGNVDPNSTPSTSGPEKLPPLNTEENAPDCAVRTCPRERLRELTKAVDEACGPGGPERCKGTDDYWTLVAKIANLEKCINARTQRERECWGGGDKGHIRQINQRNNQLDDCKKKLSRLPPET